MLGHGRAGDPEGDGGRGRDRRRCVHGQASTSLEGGRCRGGPSSLVCVTSLCSSLLALPCASSARTGWLVRFRFVTPRGGLSRGARYHPSGSPLRGRNRWSGGVGRARWAGGSVTRRDGRPGRRVAGGGVRRASRAAHSRCLASRPWTDGGSSCSCPPASWASPAPGARPVSASPSRPGPRPRGRPSTRGAGGRGQPRGGRSAPSAAGRPAGVVSRLPGTGSSLALTVDDGTSSEVVAALVALARRPGCGSPSSRTASTGPGPTMRGPCAPLIESGQVAARQPHLVAPGPHHADRRADRRRAHPQPGVPARPPSASADAVLPAAVRLPRRPRGPHRRRSGHPPSSSGTARWATPGDHPPQLMANARTWFQPQHIVIGHANHPAVTTSPTSWSSSSTPAGCRR